MPAGIMSHVLLGVGVVAVADLAAGADLLEDDAAVHTGVLGDLADGGLQSRGDDPARRSSRRRCRVAISFSTAGMALT